jgi:H+-translocating NAD(P) transhydrogenase subunit alpha
MRVGVVHETAPGERRVALIPPEVEAIRKAGHDVIVETGAGSAAGFSDATYAERGAKVGGHDDVFAAELLVFVRAPGADEHDAAAHLAALRPGQTTVGLADPLGSPRGAAAVADRGVTSFALELLPRITRAQAMDVLSSQAALAGYKAALIAAARLNKIMPMLTTAAGTLPPARALVIGAGVAGLQAIATCRRLGAVVSGYDVRAASREQVESVGGTFVELSVDTAAAEGAGGYAAAMGEEFYRRQRAALGEVVAAHDIVITTAQVPGVRAPVLVTADMVHAMAPGSVIVDVAAAQGGNCELAEPDRTVDVDGVTVVAPTNLAGTVPAHASRLYAKNLGNFLRHLLVDDRVRLDMEDPIIADTLVTHGGEVVSPRVRDLLGLPPLAAAAGTTAAGGGPAEGTHAISTAAGS